MKRTNRLRGVSVRASHKLPSFRQSLIAKKNSRQEDAEKQTIRTVVGRKVDGVKESESTCKHYLTAALIWCARQPEKVIYKMKRASFLKPAMS